MQHIKLEVDQLECTSCAVNIDNFLKKQKGIDDWDVNVLDKTVEIDYDSSIYTPEDIVKLIKKSGFDAEIVDE